MKPVDPVDRICSDARELYVKNLVERKLYHLVNKLEGMSDGRIAVIARVLDYLADDIAQEAATVYTSICKEKVKAVLEELRKEEAWSHGG